MAQVEGPKYDEHGNTPAAWTAIIIMMVGALIGCIGVGVALPWMFWVGIGIGVFGAIVGKVMQKMGLGQMVPATNQE